MSIFDKAIHKLHKTVHEAAHVAHDASRHASELAGDVAGAAKHKAISEAHKTANSLHQKVLDALGVADGDGQTAPMPPKRGRPAKNFDPTKRVTK